MGHYRSRWRGTNTRGRRAGRRIGPSRIRGCAARELSGCAEFGELSRHGSDSFACIDWTWNARICIWGIWKRVKEGRVVQGPEGEKGEKEKGDAGLCLLQKIAHDLRCVSRDTWTPWSDIT